ncbi:MAG: hypothetical protein AAGG51_19750 [Cyanobacteria bacterium P01_G01_bin.54]
MLIEVLVVIENSLGFALRDIRAQVDFISFLSKRNKVNLKVFGGSRFREVAVNSFLKYVSKIEFIESEKYFPGRKYINCDEIRALFPEGEILTGSIAVKKMRELLGKKYLTLTDSLGLHYPIPKGNCLFVKNKTILELDTKLSKIASKVRNRLRMSDSKVIFFLFSGLKSFGTDYGKSHPEKERIKKYMTFPFEESIPAIGEIQNQLLEIDIIVVPICIQYGDLDSIQKTVSNLGKKHKLIIPPEPLGIDWNNDIERQVGLLHALHNWSHNVGLPSIAVVHGSSCLHLLEECVNSSEILTFFATHTERLAPENDGRVYHINVAKSGCQPLSVVQPNEQNSHDYRIVAKNIVEEVYDFYRN